MIAQLLMLSALSLCATVAGTIVWLLHRDESLDDTALLRNFLIVFGIFFGLVAGIVRTDTVRMRLDPAFRIKTEIEANALFTVINQIDASDTGGKLRRSLEAQMSAGASLAEALAHERGHLNQAARYRLGFADQQARIMWAGFVAETLRELQQKDPELCYGMMSGTAFDAKAPGSTFSAENTKAFHAALIRLYESADRGMRRESSPTNVRTDLDEGRREFAAIKDELTQRFGADVAAAIAGRTFGDAPPASAATMCRARIFQLQAILRRPQGPASMLVGDALR